MIPVVRITLERMEQTIVAALQEHCLNDDAEYQAAIRQAIESFDIPAYVEKAVKLALQQRMEHVLNAAVYKAVGKSEFTSVVEEASASAIEETLNQIRQQIAERRADA